MSGIYSGYGNNTGTPTPSARDYEWKSSRTRDHIYSGGDTGATLTITVNEGEIQQFTLTDNAAITWGDIPMGAAVLLVLTQDDTGSRVPTWPASTLFAGATAPTLSTAAGSVDLLTVVRLPQGVAVFTSGLAMATV